MSEQLQAVPEMSSRQYRFEKNCICHLHLTDGVFAINVTTNEYANKHVQWLWEQYQKGAKL